MDYLSKDLQKDVEKDFQSEIMKALQTETPKAEWKGPVLVLLLG